MPPINTPDLRQIDKALSDIGTRLDNLFKKEGPQWANAFMDSAAGAKDLGNELSRLEKELDNLEKGSEKWKKQTAAIELMHKELVKAKNAADPFFATMKMGIGLMDRFGGSIIKLGLGAFTIGLDALAKAIHKVWDVLERATKVAGEFNLQVGSLSSNMQAARKMGNQWEGAIRGLTDSQGVGMKMFADYLESFGRMTILTKDGQAFSKMMLGLARGFNLGGEGAGQFASMMATLGTSVVFDPKSPAHLKDLRDATADSFTTIVGAAKQANAPVNQFFQQFVKNKEWVNEFGKDGVQVFSKLMFYAKRFGISLESLKKFQDLTDTFDETSTRIAKINTVFGTSINAMEVMLEQDPSKRFETIRQALLNQGKSFDQLSRMERKIIAEQTGLAVDEVNAFLKSGDTLEQYEEKRAKTQKQKLEAEKQIQKAMQSTATTMFAFGAAWDKVTMAIAKLIKPFTDVLGLTKSGEKGAKSFSQVMDGLFKRLIKFIEEVAANKDWQGFMKRLADDAVNLANKISAVATGPGLSDWIKTVVKAGGDFYDIMKSAFNVIVDVGKKAMPVVKFIAEHIKEILLLWAGSKIAGAGIGAAGMFSAIGGLSGAGGLAATGAKTLGRGLLGGAAGTAVGFGAGKIAQQAGASSSTATGITAGAGIGGALGGLAGPLGIAIGTAAGGVIGGVIGKFFGKGDRGDVEEKITKNLKLRTELEEIYKDKLKERTEREAKASLTIEDLNKQLVDERGLVAALTPEQRKSLEMQIQEMGKLGLNTKSLWELMGKLSAPADGPLFLSTKQLTELQEQSLIYKDKLKELTEETDKLLKQEKDKLKSVQDEVKLEELKIKKAELEYDLGKQSVEQQKKQLSFIGDQKKWGEIYKREQELADKKKSITKESEDKILKLREKELEKQYDVTVRERALRSDEFTKFRESDQGKNLSLAEALRQFARSDSGKALLGEDDAKRIAEKKTASGGIAMSPQTRLVGEAGPEAILPLKALVTGGDSLTSAAIGAQAAEGIVNLAKGRATGPSANASELTINVPLYLDSTLVARQTTRVLLSDYDGLT